ncbi:MAG: outer membrane beta-barrel protein [Candidatus Kapaibacterium sp.]|nr:outer membrane beta-barrel protein [Bacteroidota bacterium]
MKHTLYTLLFTFLLIPVSVLAQHGAVSGTLIDNGDNKPLSSVTVAVKERSGKVVTGAVANSRGMFVVHTIPVGDYILECRLIGYDTLRHRVKITENDTLRVGALKMRQSSVRGKDVVVEEMAPRVEVKGDTMEYNSSQFKTDNNAPAEDMIKKMPGIDVSNGQVKAQGEQVKRVLVDGKPFFGDDPTTTLKNIPSDIIDRVQVFDQMSDQSQFTRFDDGERNKTLNIVTKADKRTGQFGKVYGGYGTDDRYTAGGNVNYFKNDTRLSVLLLSNNINQQNFSIQDILGAMGGGGGMMGQMMNNSMRMFGAGGRGGRSYGGGGGISDFTVNQSDGITASHGLGLNYSDSFGKSFNLSGSYFFNLTDNKANQTTNRQTFLGDNITQLAQQESDKNTKNINHRFNLRADYSIDSMSSILFTPRFTWQSNDRNNLTATNTTSNDTLLNSSNNTTTNNSSAYNINADLLYRLRFETEGRTFSINATTSARNNSGDQNTFSPNTYFLNSVLVADTIQQFTPTSGKQKTIGANASYTEPLAKNHQLQLSYNVNNTVNESDKKTYTADTATKQLTFLNPRLSNTTSSTYFTQRPGFTYKFTLEPEKDTTQQQNQGMFGVMMFGAGGRPPGGRDMPGMGGMGGNVGAWIFSIGADYLLASLSTDQTYPVASAAKRTYQHILPSFSITTRPTMFSNIRFNYRTSANQPSIQQLQNVLDNSNALQLSIGNPNLDLEVTHSLSINYGTFNVKSASGFFTMANVNFTQDKIITATTIATADTVVALPSVAPIRLGNGVQLSQPINRNGYANGNFFIVYSFPWEPFDGFKINLNTNGNVSYTRDLSLINSAENIANTTIITPSIGLSSNISSNTDFTLSGSSSINRQRNSIRSDLDQTYYTHTIRSSATFIVRDSSAWLDGWLFTGDFSYIITKGLASGYNQSIPLLNFGIGKRILDDRGEIKLSVFDALNQNSSIVRNVGSGYIEDVRTTVLQRYFLLNFTYNLRMFGK